MTNPHVESSSIRGSLLSYAIGFGTSVLLTLFSFLIAPLVGTLAAPLIVLFAVAQLVVQLVFFLHLGASAGERSRLLLFIFASVIIFILVGGTIWIMSNLAHLHMHPATPADLYEGGIVAPENELK